MKAPFLTIGIALLATTLFFAVQSAPENHVGGAVETETSETYFAEISKDGTVLRVIVADQAFIDSGVVGNSKNWIQTKYNNNEAPAVIGEKYDTRTKRFIVNEKFINIPTTEQDLTATST